MALKWARFLFWYTCGQFMVFKASVGLLTADGHHVTVCAACRLRKVAHLKCIRELAP